MLALTTLLAAIPPAAAAEQAAVGRGPAGTQRMIDAVSRAWLAAEWQSYAARFVSPEGRVIDNGNGGVSHSEGQGYGLLLAAKAGDAACFETIWTWTEKALLVRKDGLAAWKWDPAKARVETNNATDGDLLIAWALAEAARRFARADYRTAAASIAHAVAKELIVEGKAGPLLRPAVRGFEPGEQPDGPVVNLSYWVFPAFAALADLAPWTDWTGLRRAGLELIEQSRFGTFGLPVDWESLAGPRPRPAASFPPSFGYDAIRIPIYLALDGGDDAHRLLRRFAGAWAQTASTTHLLEKREGAVTVPVGEAGYDLALAVARCADAGQAPPPEMISRRSDLYYPETLRLLSVLAVQERFPSCL